MQDSQISYTHSNLHITHGHPDIHVRTELVGTISVPCLLVAGTIILVGDRGSVGTTDSEQALDDWIYTVSHKKTCHFVFDYSSGRFLYFLHQWKEEGILYTGINLNLSLHPNCVSTLPCKTVRSIEHVVRNLSRKLSNFVLFQFLVENSFIDLLWENFPHYHRFKKKLGLSSNSTYLTRRSNHMKHVTCDVMQLWRHQAIK